MKTSVVMATYNGEAYLYEQLDSLREQSRKIDEVLIYDDGSKDHTVEMIDEYIKKYQLQDTWQLNVNEKNLGYANNFHKATQAARGEFIFFADQDDIWNLDKIEKTVKIMEGRPEIQLLCTDYTPFSSSEKAPVVSRKLKNRMKNDGSIEKLELNNRNIFIASLGCVMCIRKTFRDKIEVYWKKGWAHDDFVWKMAQCVDGCYMYHKPLIKRRLHDHNVSMRKLHSYEQRMRYFRDVLAANEQMYQFGKEISMDKSKMQLLERHMKAIQLRAELVRDRKLINSFKLLAYADCYHSCKSILMEPYLAFKYAKHR